MALVRCQECEKAISEFAANCPQCGAPNTDQKLISRTAADDSRRIINPTTQRGTPECIACLSRNTVRCSLVHAQGITTRTLSGSAVSSGLGTALVGLTLTPVAAISSIGVTGALNSATGLAQLCAPPPPPKPERLATWKLILLIVCYPVGILYLLFVHLPQRSKKLKAFETAKKRYETYELPKYDKKWICLDCGTIREVDAPSIIASMNPPIQKDGTA